MKTSYINNSVFTNFTIIPNDMINQPSMSFKSKGILMYLLSKPKDWIVRTSDIVSHGKEGTDSVKASMIELQELGYAKKEIVRGSDGRIKEHIWYIYNTSQNASIPTLSPQVGKTTYGSATYGKSTPTNTNSTNTDNTNISSKEYINIFGKDYELNSKHKIKFVYSLQEKLVNGLEKIYPKELTGISDRKFLERLWEAMQRRKGKDTWMSEDPFENLIDFIENYKRSVDERMLVGSVYNLATKMRDCRIRGSYNFTAQNHEQE